MKKVLKVAKVIGKWYAITTVGIYAFHGAADYLQRLMNFDGEDGRVLDNVGEYSVNMIRDDLKTIKENFFGTFYYRKWF